MQTPSPDIVTVLFFSFFMIHTTETVTRHGDSLFIFSCEQVTLLFTLSVRRLVRRPCCWNFLSKGYLNCIKAPAHLYATDVVVYTTSFFSYCKVALSHKRYFFFYNAWKILAKMLRYLKQWLDTFTKSSPLYLSIDSKVNKQHQIHIGISRVLWGQSIGTNRIMIRLPGCGIVGSRTARDAKSPHC